MNEAQTAFDSTFTRGRNVKIAIIGSSRHCRELLKVMAHNAEKLTGCYIVLTESDDTRLEALYTLGSNLFKHAAAPIRLARTTSQEEALSDADFVLTAFQVGGIQARRLDEKLPLRHGLIGHKLVGAGGFFSALRTVPVIAGIATEMEKVAPRAFLLNYTYPGNIVTEAITHTSGIRTIGISDDPIHAVQRVAKAAGICPEPGSRLYPRTIGLTSANWTTAAWCNGMNLLPEIIAWSEEFISKHSEITAENYKEVMQATLMTRYKAIPSHYMHYYYFPERMLEFLQMQEMSQVKDVIATQPRTTIHDREEVSQKVPLLTKTDEMSDFGEMALGILCTILNNRGEEWVLNVPNGGALNFLAPDRVVEVPCRVDARGAIPFALGDGGLKIDQRGLLGLLAEYQGATARAALWGTRHDAIRALAINPLVMSYSKAEQIYDELAAAHAQYLPERLLS